MKTSDPAAPPTECIAVRVLLFSALREKVGQPVLEATLADGATGRELLDRLAERHPAVAAYRRTLRLAVNETYTTEDVALHDGDEVALITPVSGG